MNDRLPYESFLIAPHAELPYSKGVMAKTLMVTGIRPARAYSLAQQIERQLNGNGARLDSRGVFELAADVLREHEGETAMLRLRRYKALHDLDLPVIVLIGGSTGAGKSVVAAEVAHRLGITRLTSTDFLRQAMRAFFAEDFMPSIHYSSFEAGEAVGDEYSTNSTVDGFREQARNVLVGVDALLGRALTEGLSMVLEGVHLVPGLVPAVEGRALIVSCVLIVDDPRAHVSRFTTRQGVTDNRAAARYLRSLDEIRSIEQFLALQAEEYGVPVIVNRTVETTIDQVLDLTLLAVEDVGAAGGCLNGATPSVPTAADAISLPAVGRS
jgi:2-phosphoglycerate kinase